MGAIVVWVQTTCLLNRNKRVSMYSHFAICSGCSWTSAFGNLRCVHRCEGGRLCIPHDRRWTSSHSPPTCHWVFRSFAFKIACVGYLPPCATLVVLLKYAVFCVVQASSL